MKTRKKTRALKKRQVTCRLLKLVCECDEPRILRATRKVLDGVGIGWAGSGIKCLICRGEFREADDAE